MKHYRTSSHMHSERKTVIGALADARLEGAPTALARAKRRRTVIDYDGFARDVSRSWKESREKQYRA